MNSDSKQRLLDIVLLTCFSLLLMFVPLNKTPIWDTDEAYFAEGAKEMVRTGDYIVPRNLGTPLEDYPPLMYWLIALSSFLFGGFSDFSVRFPSAVAGWGCVLLTYFFGRFFFDRLTGLFAGLMMLTIFGFVPKAYVCQPDMVLTFFITFSMYLFVRYYLSREKKKALLLGFYLLLGLAVLTKGPQGVALPALIIFLFLVMRKDFKALWGLQLFRGIFILVVMVGWWIFAVWKNAGTDFVNGFLHENLDMFLGGKRLMHQAGFFHYFERLPGLTLPWIFFLVSGVFAMLAIKEERGKQGGLLFLTWLGVVLLVFSMAQAKRVYYLLPLYSAFSLITVHFWLRFPVNAKPLWSRILRSGPFVLLILSGVGGLVSCLFFSHELREELQPHASKLIILSIVGILLAVVVAILFLCKRERASFGVLALSMAGVLFFYGVYGAREGDPDAVSGFAFCARVNSQIQPKETLYLYHEHVQLYLAFHLNVPFSLATREVLEREVQGERSSFLIVAEEDYKQDVFLKASFVELDRAVLEKGNILFCKRL